MTNITHKSPAGLTMTDFWVFLFLANLAWVPPFDDVAAHFACLFIMIAFAVRNRNRWITAFKEIWSCRS